MTLPGERAAAPLSYGGSGIFFVPAATERTVLLNGVPYTLEPQPFDEEQASAVLEQVSDVVSRGPLV